MKEETYEHLRRFVFSKAPEAKCVQCRKDGQVGYAILARPSAGRTVTPVVKNKRKAWMEAAKILGWNGSMLAQ